MKNARKFEKAKYYTITEEEQKKIINLINEIRDAHEEASRSGSWRGRRTVKSGLIRIVSWRHRVTSKRNSNLVLAIARARV